MFLVPAHMTACSSYKFHHILHSSDHTCMYAMPLRGPKCDYRCLKAPTLALCQTWKCTQQAASGTCVGHVLIAANTRVGTVTAKHLTALPKTRCQLSAGARDNALRFVLRVNGLQKCATTVAVYIHASLSRKGLLRKIQILKTINERPMSWHSHFGCV